MEDQALRAQISQFLDGESRLIQYPAKLRPKLLSLFYLAEKFEPGTQYTEKEVNELLRRWHTFSDWAMLRRDLYDRRFLDRDSRGSTYWLRPNQPTLADFGL